MAVDLKSLSDQALVHEILSSERTLLTARFRHSQNMLEDTSELARIRKGIARLRTEVRGRELASGVAKDSMLSKYSASFAPKASEATGASGGGFLSGIVDKLAPQE